MITREQFLNRARSYIGVVEGTPRHTDIIKAYNAITPLPRGYSLTVKDAWCAGFVSAIANMCGFGNEFPYECSVSQMEFKSKKMKLWAQVETPREGWLVVYDWQEDGHPDHVGIVDSVTPKQIKVIEGNYKDAVRIRTIKKDSKLIRGYIALRFKDSDIKSNLEIAREVIKGKWGNGSERVTKLKKAGYDPETIQKLVNKML